MKKSFHDTPESERRIGVVLEHLDDKISTVAEQYSDIKSDTGSIKKTLDLHTETLASHSVDLAIIKENIEFIKGSLKKKVDVEEFTALERRVAILEKRSR